MNSRSRFLRRCVLVLVAALLSALALPVQARRSSEFVLDQRTAKKFIEIREALDAEDYKLVRRLLDNLRMDRLKPYPQALAYQTYGILATENDDFAEAAKQFAKALALDALPEQQQASIRFNLGQIYMMLDRWEEAIETLNKWFETAENPRPVAFYMLALAYYQSGERQKALEPALQAYERAEDPRESWIGLPLAIYMENKEYEKAVPLLERLILMTLNKRYFTQLAAVLSQLEREKDAFAVRQLAHAKGLLTDDNELILLSQVYAYHGIPWQAAKILERGLESGRIEGDAQAWQLLSTSLLAARENERALEPLQKAAALSEDGNLYVRLSQVHIQSERWGEAQQALREAFAKGDLRDPGHAHLLAGIAAFQQQRYGQARRSFARARAHEDSRDMAERWMEFVDREAAQAARAAESAQTS